jgi:hypothetical protein
MKRKRGRGYKWTRADINALKTYSKLCTRVTTISREMRRTPQALRWKAWQLQVPLGHRHLQRRSG